MGDKIALVTGAGQGIGRAIALRLAQDGFHVAINDINAETGKLVSEEIKGLGRESLFVEADVSKRDEVFDMVSNVVQKLGRLDVMVSNAGIAQVKSLIEVTEEDLDRMFGINLYGTIYCLQAAAEQMIKQKSGKIINAASVAGRKGSPYLGHYSASKFAVVGITQSAAQELGQHGITVNAYCPGIVDTKMWEVIDPGLGKYLNLEKGKAMERSAGRAVLGRKEVPEDIVGTVSFLASKDSDFMTGQSLVIDGGMLFS